MPSHAPEAHTALRMAPLFDRGLAALRAYTESRPHVDDLHRDMLLTTAAGLDVVTHADFIANAALVLRHVIHNGAPTHVLCDNGAMCALIERRAGTW